MPLCDQFEGYDKLTPETKATIARIEGKTVRVAALAQLTTAIEAVTELKEHIQSKEVVGPEQERVLELIEAGLDAMWPLAERLRGADRSF